MTPEGVPWVEVIRSCIRALSWLEPGATVELEVDAVEGVLLSFDMESDAHFNFIVAGDAASAPQRVPITFGVNTCTPDAGSIAPGKVGSKSTTPPWTGAPFSGSCSCRREECRRTGCCNSSRSCPASVC